MKRFAYVLLAAGALAAAPGVGHAAPISITAGMPSFTITWTNQTGVAGVVASGTATFSNFSYTASNKVEFSLAVVDTSSGNTAGDLMRLTALGWDTAPHTSGSTSNGNAVFTATSNASLSGDSVSICLYGGPNCNGGGTGGLYDVMNDSSSNPNSTTMTVDMTFSTAVPPLTFDNFDAKFQTYITAYESLGTCTTGCPVTGNQTGVPEPASMALLGAGLAGLGFMRRRIA